jgi:hypothetical protein
MGSFSVGLNISAGEVIIVEEMIARKEEDLLQDYSVTEVAATLSTIEDEITQKYDSECFKITTDQEYLISARSMSIIQTEMNENNRITIGKSGCAMITDTKSNETDATALLVVNNVVIRLVYFLGWWAHFLQFPLVVDLCFLLIFSE